MLLPKCLELICRFSINRGLQNVSQCIRYALQRRMHDNKPEPGTKSILNETCNRLPVGSSRYACATKLHDDPIGSCYVFRGTQRFAVNKVGLIHSVSLICHRVTKKKPARIFLAGLWTIAGLLLAVTTASRTHAPLARHLFYVFIDAENYGVLAHYVDAIHIHQRSKTNLVRFVKFD